MLRLPFRLVLSVFLTFMQVAAFSVAGEMEPGMPKSEQRATWCRAHYLACVETAKKPGFLGGALNWCNDGGKNCSGECERRYGEHSPCLTENHPQ